MKVWYLYDDHTFAGTIDLKQEATLKRILGNRKFWIPRDMFRIFAHDRGRFVVQNTRSDDPCPVFDGLEEARAYVARQYTPMTNGKERDK